MYHDPLSGYRNARGVPSRAMPDYIHSDYMFMIYKSGCMCFHTEAAVYLTIMISGYLIVHVISRLWFGMCMMIIS